MSRVTLLLLQYTSTRFPNQWRLPQLSLSKFCDFLLVLLLVTALVHDGVVVTATTTTSSSRQNNVHHVYTDSFPTFDEYDYSILDPNNIYGSPYGGFSRAARSRLAALPLYLPDLLSDDDNNNINNEDKDDDNENKRIRRENNEQYFDIRDMEGRLFICRLYNEDELVPSSLEESMFTAPRLRRMETEPDESTDTATTTRATHQDHSEEIIQDNDIGSSFADEPKVTILASPNQVLSTVLDQVAPSVTATNNNNNGQIATTTTTTGVALRAENNDGTTAAATDTATTITTDADGGLAGAAAVASSATTTDGTEESTNDVALVDKMLKHGLQVQNKMNELEGICGQVHKGWWSYEVCFGQIITQFHIDVNPSGEIVSIESLTNLGTFVERNILVTLENEPLNELAEELPEFGRVIDILDHGERCEETGLPRKTYVRYLCCSHRILSRRQGMIHKDGAQITSDIASVVEVIEDQTCQYNVTVCTPVLCGYFDDEEDDDLLSPSSKKLSSSSSDDETESSKKNKMAVRKPKDNETIQEILDRSFGDGCIHTIVGWWTYEVCYKGKIRQYHEEYGSKRNEVGTTIPAKVVQSEHILGVYHDGHSEAPSKPWGEEWSLVVNATSEKHSVVDTGRAASASSSGSSSGVGGAATTTYYEVTYTAGDTCDGHDVKDSAIVAGSVAGTPLQRATAVRYFCGPTLDISVNEDSTCHYVVQISVPNLCTHPLFREPVAKKQILKCLPATIDDENE